MRRFFASVTLLLAATFVSAHPAPRPEKRPDQNPQKVLQNNLDPRIQVALQAFLPGSQFVLSEAVPMPKLVLPELTPRQIFLPGMRVLAEALITGSGPVELPVVAQQAFPVLRFSLLEVSLEWEILDPRETRYILTRPDDLASDLRMLQRRYQELADAPPLADAERFPDRAVVNELLVFNRAYRSYIEMRQPTELAHGADLRAVQREVDYLYQVWDAVRDARCEYYYVTVRRNALKRLRDLLGVDDYYRGELPPHVPIWRFRELK